MVDQNTADIIGAFLSWVEKRDRDLRKRLGPKLTESFYQYVDMMREATK